MTGLTPNAFAKGADKVFDTGVKAVTSPFKGKKTNKPNQPGSGAKPDLTKEKPNKYAGKTFKTVSTSMKLGGDKKKDIVKGGSKVGDAVNKVAKDITKK